jgi:gliding motility-associated-like protein
MRYSVIVFFCLWISVVERSLGQSISCPPNIDFELGNLNNWVLYTGSCCPISTPALGAVANRHTITSGAGVDPYGGFPIVAPGGNYSLKLGNSINGAQAERARYYVHVPAGINNYSLIFRYAVVFEDPGHTAAEQPRFEVKGYDSTTGLPIPCAQFTFVASSVLPGFNNSPIPGPGQGNPVVRYKAWSTASINLSGYAGKTVAVDFASGDCGLTGHFGYGYVDINCTLFQISTSNCSNSATTTLTAPPGFFKYEWRDSSLAILIDTLQSITIATPPVTTKYAVILKPYPGFGCPDTLYTYMKIFSLNTVLGNDTLICKNDTAKIKSVTTGSAPPFTYAWSPVTSLSCANCANPTATPGATASYIMTVTDENGCTKADTIIINVDQGPQVTLTDIDVSCFGFANGSVSSSVSGGISPYTYSWNTVPVTTTSAIAALVTGVYTVLVKDSLGCKMVVADTITQPALLKDTLTHFNVLCNGGSNGGATVLASGGTAPYGYQWNTVPQQNTATISGLVAGSYIVTVTDAQGCSKNDTVIITQPNALNASVISHTNVSCYGGANGSSGVLVSGGTPPYNYSWNTSPVKTTATATGLATGIYTVTITDAQGCIKQVQDTITQPQSLTAVASKTDVLCMNGTDGTANVVVSGGTAPYKYSWNTVPAKLTASVTGLAAGTYTVTVSDTLLCATNAVVSIGQPTAIASVVSKTDVSCNSGSNGSASIVISGGTAPYTYLWNTVPAQLNATVTSLLSGTYIVLTKDAHNCVKSDTVTIAQPTQLNTSISKTNATCFGGTNGTATVAATGGTAPYLYSWTSTPVQITTTAQNLSIGTYIVTVTDNKGCLKKDTAIISQPNVLTATISKTDVSCYGGNNGTATVIATGGTMPYQYSWNSTPLQTTAAAQNLSIGTYIVTVTDNKGCLKKDTAIISQPNVLTATTSKTDVSCYGGNNGTALVTASGGMAPYTYNWSTTPAQLNAAAANLTVGTYTIVVKDNENCQVAASATINQPAALSLTATHTDASCFGYTNGSVSIAVTGGTTPYSYSWNTNPQQITAQVNNLQAGTYIATVQDGHQCTANTTVIVGEPGSLSTVMSKTDISCFNGSDGTAGISVAGGTIPYSYSWNTTPAQTTPLATGLSVGSYIVSVTDAKGCTRKDTAALTQPPLLTALTTVTDISCHYGENGIATVIANGGTTPYVYSWSTQPVQTSTIVTGLTAGKYTVQVTDAKGCKTSVVTDSLQQPDEIMVSASAMVMTCLWAANGTGKVDSVYGGVPPYAIMWNTNPVQYTDTVHNLPAGIFTVTIIDSNNCTKSANIIINNFPLAEVNAGPDVVICPGDSVQLTATGTASYQWSPSGTLSCILCQSPVATPSQNTIYTVIGTDTHNCNDTDEVLVTIAERLGGDVGPGLKICRGDSIQLYAAGGISYLWSPALGMNNSTLSEPWVKVEGETKFSVLIKENDCFTDTLYQLVRVYDRPSVELGPDLSGVPGATLQLHAIVTNATGIAWAPATGLSCTDCYDPLASLFNTITYTAYVNNDSICYAEDNITIRVACDGSFLFVPNTFTPNGDGRNDYFYASAQGLDVINLMRVYNRWGEKIFEARNIAPGVETSGWDGKYKNAELSPDVYVYYLEVYCANGETIFLKGDISLIR